MPAHLVHISDREPAAEQLAAAIQSLQPRETIISVVQVGATYVIVTEKARRTQTEKRAAQ